MIYLDNNATTPVREEVKEAMLPYLTDEFGNPASKYYPQAIKAHEAVKEARFHVASLINASPEEIIFTAGAAEANNMIIKGVADFQKFYAPQSKNHIITSTVEHESVLNTFKFLNGELYSNKDATLAFGGNKKVDRGYKVDFASVNEYGQVTVDTLSSLLTDDTSLVSLIWGNNEIGSLNDIETLAKLCKDKKILFHSDGTQVLGRVDVDVQKVPVDFLSFSAHKLNGPKGVGCAFLRTDDYGRRPQLTSLIHGGEQEYGLRAGTHAVHNIVGFGKAAELAKKELNSKIEKLNSLELELKKGLLEAIPEIEFIGDPVNKVPGVLSFVINKEMFNNEVFIKKVADQIAVSAGSACTAGNPSHVLQHLVPPVNPRAFIRISLSNYSTSILTICNIIKTAL
ncbi:MAG: cysteine desulfurase family protein [Clostridium sp.]|nr:cysteine desulfurase family protein [Clostridium sp.]